MTRMKTELDRSFEASEAKEFVEFLDSVGFMATTKPLAEHPQWIRVAVKNQHHARVSDMLIGWIAGRRST